MPLSGRTQRRLSVVWLAVPQRMDLGQGKARMMVGTISAITSVVARPGFSTTAKRMLLRSEEHTSELQSLMRISYAVFCLKNKPYNNTLLNSMQPMHN